MKKLGKKDHLNLFFSAFLVLAFIVCAYFFSGFSSSMDALSGQLVMIAVYAVFGLLLFYATRVGDGKAVFRFSPLTLLFLVLLFALIVVHELIHGLSWSIFTPRHWKDVEFGFMKQYLTPYCTCRVPLAKGQYIFGALMPLVLLGLIPMVAGILTGSISLMLLGVVMTDSAAGDILIVWKILRYRSDAGEIVYVDHPTQAGGVIFER